MHRTKIEADLANAELAHADDEERAELLRRARRFKTSWIELAEALVECKRDSRWKSWGYESFEAYAKAELHLRGETADKLTGSFAFLKRRAPAVLERDPLHEPMPSYHAVDFLRRAEENDGAPREAVAEIRRRVIDEAAPVASVSKLYKDVVFPVDEDTQRARDAAAIKNVARRLREILKETRAVPKRMASEVGSALDALLEALDGPEGKGDPRKSGVL